MKLSLWQRDKKSAPWISSKVHYITYTVHFPGPSYDHKADAIAPQYLGVWGKVLNHNNGIEIKINM